MTSYATSGGRLPRHHDARAIVGGERSEDRGVGGGEDEVERGQGDGADDGDAADGQRHVDGPVAPSQLSELTRAVQRVHDPQPSGARHVLETLLGPHVVVGVEPVELVHQQLVRHAVARGADVAQRRRVGPQLHQGTAGRLGQHGRVAVLGDQVLGHEPLV